MPALWELLLEPVRLSLFYLTQVFGGSLGLGIVTLSLGVRLALLPWSLKALRRAAEMRRKLRVLQPRIEALRARYANDGEALFKAMQLEYQKENVSPLRDSSVGILVTQMILGVVLYTVIGQGPIVTAPFLWIVDLARPDRVLSLVAAIGTAVVSVTHPASELGSRSAVAAIVGALLTLALTWHIAAGVVLYWASNTAVGVLQNAILRLSGKRERA